MMNKMLYALGKEDRIDSIHETNDTVEARNRSKLQLPSTSGVDSIEELYGHYTSVQGESRKETFASIANQQKPSRHSTINSFSRRQQLQKLNEENQQLLNSLVNVKPSKSVSNWRRKIKDYQLKRRQQGHKPEGPSNFVPKN